MSNNNTSRIGSSKEDFALASKNILVRPLIDKSKFRKALGKRTATDSEAIERRRDQVEKIAYEVEQAFKKLEDKQNPPGPTEAMQLMTFANVGGILALLKNSGLQLDILTRHAVVDVEDEAGNPILDPATGQPEQIVKRDTTAELLQDIHDLLFDQFNLMVDIKNQNGCVLGMLHDIGLSRDSEVFAAEVADENGVLSKIPDKWAPLFAEAQEEAQKKVKEERERIVLSKEELEQRKSGIE